MDGATHDIALNCISQWLYYHPDSFVLCRDPHIAFVPVVWATCVYYNIELSPNHILSVVGLPYASPPPSSRLTRWVRRLSTPLFHPAFFSILFFTFIVLLTQPPFTFSAAHPHCLFTAHCRRLFPVHSFHRHRQCCNPRSAHRIYNITAASGPASARPV